VRGWAFPTSEPQDSAILWERSVQRWAVLDVRFQGAINQVLQTVAANQVSVSAKK
jgi:hypothetical protein